MMKVLIAMEYSGRVREAFRAKGHDVTSCDLLPSEDNSPHHITGDALPVIQQGGWDLIIMHPPCTALAVSGNRWYGKGKEKHAERVAAVSWTMDLFTMAQQYSKAVAMENPVGVLPVKASQYIQPWEFGHGECKKTGLWIAGLAPLTPTDIVSGREQRVWKMGPSPERWKERSRTFQGVADAMATQWG
jgi:hypothetical protein